MNNINQNRVCTKCLCDTSMPSIVFDISGECNFCKTHKALKDFYDKEKKDGKLEKIIEKIKKDGKGKEFDCVIGVSGGTDSTYTLYMAKKYGLRPLAVFFDNGWAKQIAVSNIRKICSAHDVELYTYVVDWEEFKDLQRSVLKASVPDLEIPTDIGIQGTLYSVAKKENIKYILVGSSFATEGTVPVEWSFIDGTYLKSIHKKFGTKKIKSFPIITVPKVAWFTLALGIKQIPILNYVEYSKEEAQVELKEKFDWDYYGGHHHENLYTHVAVSYIAPKKFGFDRRKILLSAMIREGRILREEAIEKLSIRDIVSDEDISYCIKKLGFSEDEWRSIMQDKPKKFTDFRTSFTWLKYGRFFIKIISNLGFISPVVYKKFASNQK